MIFNMILLCFLPEISSSSFNLSNKNKVKKVKVKVKVKNFSRSSPLT